MPTRIETHCAFVYGMWIASITHNIDPPRLMPFHIRLFRWIAYLLGILFLLIITYGVGRLLHVAQGSIYLGERAPYLQMPAAHGMTLRWQSVNRYRGEVRYGLSPEHLDQHSIETEIRQSHELRLSNLLPATRYYYAVGAQGGELKADAEQWFMTAPPPHAGQPVRFWVLGDPGLAIPGQAHVRDAALAWMHAHPRENLPYMDLLMTTGDNAYKSGKNEEFQRQFFTPFGAVLRNIPAWPVYGNHDARRWSFFDIFTFPDKAQSGGVASGTEHYYAFDYGQVHFVVLDSHDADRSRQGAMAKWLRRDLKANQLPWVITLFHHPPYSKGSHDSDNSGDSRGRMVDMRNNILPILEQGGVDLVLAGHSHMYERSYLIDCQYDLSNTIQASMMLSDDKQRYYKRSYSAAPHEGTIYAVVGSSARADYGPLDHPIMATSLMEIGSLVVDINRNKLEGRFINGDGMELDHFSITKGVESAPVGTCK